MQIDCTSIFHICTVKLKTDCIMEKDYFKYYHPQFLIFLIVGAFFLIYFTKKSLGLSLSVFGVLSLVIISITKYLWKFKPFSWFIKFKCCALNLNKTITDFMSVRCKKDFKYFNVNKKQLICFNHFLNSS